MPRSGNKESRRLRLGVKRTNVPFLTGRSITFPGEATGHFSTDDKKPPVGRILTTPRQYGFADAKTRRHVLMAKVFDLPGPGSPLLLHPTLDGLLNEHQEGIGVVGLANEVLTAGRAALANDIGSLHTADNDHGDVASLGTIDQLLANRETVHAGKPQIEQNQRRPLGSGKRQTLLARGGRQRLEALPSESKRENVHHGLVVVNDENPIRFLRIRRLELRAVEDVCGHGREDCLGVLVGSPFIVPMIPRSNLGKKAYAKIGHFYRTVK